MYPSPLTVVLYGSGSPMSQIAARQIARDHRLVGVIAPQPRAGLVSRLRHALSHASDVFADIDAPRLTGEDLHKVRPDVIVVASFPALLPMEQLASARIGAINLHMSLLPRHRGVDPVFWTYWHDDREAGVTLHWMDEGLDKGDIIVQDRQPLSRGLASRSLYRQLAESGATLLANALKQLQEGTLPRQSQDERAATYESAADIARARVPFAKWPAERVWHLLSGVGDQRSGLIDDVAGKPLAHGRATGWTADDAAEPGRIVTLPSGYQLHCRDGIVTLSRAH